MRSTACQAFCALQCLQDLACIIGILLGVAGVYFLNAFIVHDFGKAAVYTMGELICVLALLMCVFVTVSQCRAIKLEYATRKLALDESYTA